jgi:hypothetical protein
MSQENNSLYLKILNKVRRKRYDSPFVLRDAMQTGNKRKILEGGGLYLCPVCAGDGADEIPPAFTTIEPIFVVIQEAKRMISLLYHLFYSHRFRPR